MWLILSDGFMSAVVDKTDPELVQVRARRKEHLAKYFPNHEIVTYDNRDYQFRVVVKKADLAAVLIQYIGEMSYTNFKDSVKDRRFHDACYDVWHTMAAIQPRPPYSNYSGAAYAQRAWFSEPGAGKTAKTRGKRK